jgi:hypothetical protein
MKPEVLVEGVEGVEDRGMEIIDGRIGEEIDLPHNAKALDVLQAVYLSPRFPLHTRMRAAALAIPYESPKLAVTALVTHQDFSARLARAIQRSDSVRLIPAAEPPKQIEIVEPAKAAPAPTASPDRRFIRRV